MTAHEIARQKYLLLMTEVEELEDQIAALEKQPPSTTQKQEIEQLQEKLGARRTELTRLSDGCGTPHSR
jgi:hypothetical protein